MRIMRGKRRSLIVTAGRWRLRVVPGQFRIGYRSIDRGVGSLALKVLLVTWVRERSAA